MSSDPLVPLATWIADLEYAALASEVRGQALRIIADTLAVAIAGGAEPEVRGLADRARRWGGSGPSTVIATGRSVSPYAAAVVNAQASISLELDEGNQWATNHPAAHVLPAALAVTEEVGASGSDLLCAFIAGYEVAARAGRAMTVRDQVHPFGTAMVVGAAAACARIQGLDVVRTAEALRVAAALTPASTQRAANMGATVRNLITGLSSGAGVLATDAVESGVSGDIAALETVYGVLLGDSFDVGSLTRDLGSEWLMTRNYFKVHACSRWNHAPIEATIKILNAHHVVPEEVESIRVHTFAPATRLDNSEPPNHFAGKHSIPYNIAVRIALGHNGVDAYRDEVVQDPVLRRLMSQVHVIEDPDYTAAQPAVRSARVEIWTSKGEVWVATEHRSPGGFDNPYPEAVLDEKFAELVSRGRSSALVMPLREWVANLPDHTTVTGLRELLRRDADSPHPNSE